MSDKLPSIEELEAGVVGREEEAASAAPSVQELESGATAQAQEDSLPDQLEAAARGAAEGVTLGSSEEIASGIAALPKSSEGWEALKSEYRRIKAAQEGRREALEKQYPFTSAGSEIAGGFMAPLPGTTGLSAAKGLSRVVLKAPLLGAGYGALQAAGKSKAPITSEDFKEDVTEGAVAGSLGGLAGEAAIRTLGGLGRKVGGFISDLETTQAAKKQWELGTEGIRTIGSKARKEMEELQGDASQAFFKAISPESPSNLKNQILAKEYKAIKEAAKKGNIPELDVPTALDKGVKDLETLKAKGQTSEGLDAITTLISRIESLKERLKGMDPAEAAILAKKDIRELYTPVKGLSGGYGTTIFKTAEAPIVAEAKKIPGIPEIDKRYVAQHGLEDMLDLAGKSAGESASFSDKVLQLISQSTSRAAKAKVGSKFKVDTVENLLNEAYPEQAPELIKKFKQAVERTDAHIDGGGGGGFLSMAKGTLERLPNIAGNVQKSAKDWTTESINPVVTSLVSSGYSRLAEQVASIPFKNIKARQALLFSLMSNPEDRRILREHGFTEEEK